AIVYVPNDAAGTITVNMAQLGGLATARWYYPTTGIFATIPGSPFANTGSLAFTRPGNNAGGDREWGLVFEAASPADNTPPTIAISTPTASPTFLTNASPLALGGSAADNVGVTQVTWVNTAA